MTSHKLSPDAQRRIDQMCEMCRQKARAITMRFVWLYVGFSVLIFAILLFGFESSFGVSIIAALVISFFHCLINGSIFLHIFTANQVANEEIKHLEKRMNEIACEDAEASEQL